MIFKNYSRFHKSNHPNGQGIIIIMLDILENYKTTLTILYYYSN